MEQRMNELIPHLRRYARALVGPHASPDDLVRETLTRAAQELHYYAGQRESRVRLFTLMHQAYVEQMRAHPGAEPLEEHPPAGLAERERLMLEDFDRAITV